MEIPDEYCICERIWHKTDIYGDDATKAAQLLISDINDLLKQKNLTKICRTLTFVEVITLIWIDCRTKEETIWIVNYKAFKQAIVWNLAKHLTKFRKTREHLFPIRNLIISAW